LGRRGISAGAVTSAVEPGRAVLPALPLTLVESTVQLSIRWSAITSLVSVSAGIPATIAILADGVMKSMLLQSIRQAVIIALLSAGALGTAVLAQRGNNAKPVAIGAGPAPEPAPPVQAEASVLSAKERLQMEVDREMRTRVLLQKLEQPIDADFPQATTFADVLRHVKEQTADASLAGIPIFVSPLGLFDVQKSMTSTIVIHMKQRPARVALEEVARQMGGLSTSVADGWVIFESQSGYRFRLLEQKVSEIDRKLDQVVRSLERLEKAK
jgi:hypothetical protein